MYADVLIVGVDPYPAEIAQTDTTNTRTINCMRCMYMCMREKCVEKNCGGVLCLLKLRKMYTS